MPFINLGNIPPKRAPFGGPLGRSVGEGVVKGLEANEENKNKAAVTFYQMLQKLESGKREVYMNTPGFQQNIAPRLEKMGIPMTTNEQGQRVPSFTPPTIEEQEAAAFGAGTPTERGRRVFGPKPVTEFSPEEIAKSRMAELYPEIETGRGVEVAEQKRLETEAGWIPEQKDVLKGQAANYFSSSKLAEVQAKALEQEMKADQTKVLGDEAAKTLEKQHSDWITNIYNAAKTNYGNALNRNDRSGRKNAARQIAYVTKQHIADMISNPNITQWDSETGELIFAPSYVYTTVDRLGLEVSSELAYQSTESGRAREGIDSELQRTLNEVWRLQQFLSPYSAQQMISRLKEAGWGLISVDPQTGAAIDLTKDPDAVVGENNIEMWYNPGEYEEALRPTGSRWYDPRTWGGE